MAEFTLYSVTSSGNRPHCRCKVLVLRARVVEEAHRMLAQYCQG